MERNFQTAREPRDFRQPERSRSVEILTVGAPSGYFAATILAGVEIA
jgi:hypothetical protein